MSAVSLCHAVSLLVCNINQAELDNQISENLKIKGLGGQMYHQLLAWVEIPAIDTCCTKQLWFILG